MGPRYALAALFVQVILVVGCSEPPPGTQSASSGTGGDGAGGGSVTGSGGGSVTGGGGGGGVTGGGGGGGVTGGGGGGSVTGGCAPNYVDCDGDTGNGCEIYIGTDPDHCGDCATVCTAGPSQVPFCVDGVCATACEAGRADCDGDPLNGCEADLLTTPQHCGACGHDCVVGECVAAKCNGLTLLSNLDTPWYLALDAGYVYVSVGGDGTIVRVPKDGSGPVETVASNINYARQIAVDATDVYWVDGTGPFGEGAIMKGPSAGGAPTTLVSGLDNPTWLAIDATHVYYDIYKFDGSEIFSVAKGGGPTTLLSTAPSAYGLAVDASHVYWATGFDMINLTAGGVSKAPTGGGPATTLALDSGGWVWEDIAIDAMYAYYTNDSMLRRVPKTGGASETLVGLPGEILTYLAVDNTHAYFTTAQGSGGSSIRRVTLDGTTIETIVVDDVLKTDLEVDDTGVYFIEVAFGGEGSVRRFAK